MLWPNVQLSSEALPVLLAMRMQTVYFSKERTLLANPNSSKDCNARMCSCTGEETHADCDMFCLGGDHV